MRYKSQVSSEFFIFVGLAFLIAIAFALASLDQLQDFRLERESEAVKDLALKLQKELLIAASVEDGYVRVFEIPSKIDNIDYTVTTFNSTIVMVQSKNSLYFVPIPRVIGNVSKGTNVINKTEGNIYVNSNKIIFFTDYTTCQSAESLGLCDGLDIVFGPGYKCSCCSEHSYCCTGC